MEVVVDFPFSSNVLTLAGEEGLKKALAQARSDRWCSLELVTVIGYAQQEEAAPHQLQGLSRRRAESVVTWLCENGVDERTIFFEGQRTKASTHLSGDRSDPRAVVVMQGTPSNANCKKSQEQSGLAR